MPSEQGVPDSLTSKVGDSRDRLTSMVGGAPVGFSLDRLEPSPLTGWQRYRIFMHGEPVGLVHEHREWRGVALWRTALDLCPQPLW
jgi:hypothetical protein